MFNFHLFLASAALLLPLTACTASTSDGPPSASNMSSSDASIASSAPSAPPFTFIPYTEASPAPEADVRVVDVEVQNFAFIPNAISLRQGEKVTLKVTSTTGDHSFMAADLGVNVKVSEGQTVYVDIPTEEAGTFSFRCAVPCGSGHMDMTGTIVIE